jgi:hypothetical protein
MGLMSHSGCLANLGCRDMDFFWSLGYSERCICCSYFGGYLELLVTTLKYSVAFSYFKHLCVVLVIFGASETLLETSAIRGYPLSYKEAIK